MHQAGKGVSVLLILFSFEYLLQHHRLHNIPSSCTTRTKPRRWRSWSSKHILTRLHPDKVHTSLGSGCLQSLTQGSSLLWLCLENFTPHSKKQGSKGGKKPNHSKAFLSMSLQPQYSTSVPKWIFSQVQLHDHQPFCRASRDLPKKHHETPGWSHPTQLPSSLLFSQKVALWQSVSFCEITEINDKMCIFLAHWEHSKVFSSH